jgi:hypothetical protein
LQRRLGYVVHRERTLSSAAHAMIDLLVQEAAGVTAEPAAGVD